MTNIVPITVDHDARIVQMIELLENTLYDYALANKITLATTLGVLEIVKINIARKLP